MLAPPPRAAITSAVAKCCAACDVEPECVAWVFEGDAARIAFSEIVVSEILAEATFGSFNSVLKWFQRLLEK